MSKFISVQDSLGWLDSVEPAIARNIWREQYKKRTPFHGFVNFDHVQVIRQSPSKVREFLYNTETGEVLGYDGRYTSMGQHLTEGLDGNFEVSKIVERSLSIVGVQSNFIIYNPDEIDRVVKLVSPEAKYNDIKQRMMIRA